MKKLLFLTTSLIIFCANSSFCHQISENDLNSRIKKDLQTYLQYQKNVLKVKDELWKVKLDLRELAKIERWSSDKLSNEIQNFEDLRLGLSYGFKGLNNYEDEEFVHNFVFAKEVLTNVVEARREVTQKLKANENVDILIKDLNILVRRATNQVRELFRAQQINEDVYRSKRGSDTAGDNLSLGFLRSRARTADVRRDITRIKIEADEIRKTRRSNFVLFKRTYQEYDILSSEARLVELKAEILDIITILEAQIREERITQRAIFLL